MRRHDLLICVLWVEVLEVVLGCGGKVVCVGGGGI